MALPTPLRRLAGLLPALALGFGLAASTSVLAQTATPSQGLTAEQRKAIVALIRETLLQNPEIIQEPFNAVAASPVCTCLSVPTWEPPPISS